MAPNTAAMSAALAQNWWAIGLRGLFGIVFGLVALLLPGVTMLSLVLVFALYALLDGVFAIVAGFWAASRHERWGYLLLEGLVNIAVAVLAYTWPALTVVVFVTLIAVWALISGGFMLAAAFRLHGNHGRAWLLFGGSVSVLYGLLLLIAPRIGALVLTWWLGAYALMFGIALIALAIQLRRRQHLRMRGAVA
jgi:uncharacterized membrane protein HdeD (DUF308 family)